MKSIIQRLHFLWLYKFIITKINKLATRVGAPSYQKTPVFKRNYYNFDSKKDLHNTIRSTVSNIKENIRNFKVFLNKLKYKYNDNNAHPIIKYYINKINNLNLKNKKFMIFKILI